MVRSASLFSQLLGQIPRTDFAVLSKKHQAERSAKGFQCRAQLGAMLFSHLAQADSLREICNGLACCLGKLTHLGIAKATFSYANEHRPAALFEEPFATTLERFRSQKLLGVPAGKKFRFKNKLLSLDSTTITLCLKLFPWAKFGLAKGGVKVHVLLDHDGYMPSYTLITDAKQADVHTARALDLNPGSIVAMDRGYNGFKLFGHWTRTGVFFVTRLKERTLTEVIEHRDVPQHRNILADEVIELSSEKARQDCPYPLRCVVMRNEESDHELVLLTNHLDFGATTIADIYRERWQIELFFKALKQNLKVKTFVGTSENALRIQI